VLSIASRTPVGYQQKPPDVVRGDSCRLPWVWNALCFGVPFHHADRQGLQDVVNNAQAVTQSGGTWLDDSRGNTALSLGIGDYVEYADHPRHDLPSTELTAYCRMRRTGGGNAFGGIFSNPYSTGSPFTSWIIRDDSSATGALIGGLAVNSTTLIETSATPVITLTEYITVVLRWRTGTALQLDVLGERGNTISTVTGPTNSGAVAYGGARGIRINGDEAQPTPATMNGKYSQCLVWARRLTDAEMAGLVADPFGWYSPKRETISIAAPFPVGAVPASVAQVGGVGAISGAVAAPTIDASDVVTAHTVTASPNADARFTRTVSGTTTTDTVAAGDTQVFSTGATSPNDVTFVSLDSDDTGV
jgi:hypothetical protein